MSTLVIFRVAGDSDELTAAYDRTVAGAHPSRLGHLMARTDDGMVVVEVWSSRADLDQFMKEELPGIFERAECLDVIPPRVKEVVFAPVHHAYGQFVSGDGEAYN